MFDENCIPFFESTYPEMQRKHIPSVYEYQPVATRHQKDKFWLMFHTKHHPDTVSVDF